MARCDQGYLCDVCGDEVAELADSDLYLSYILGLIEPQLLFSRPERHIRCNATQAQFIVDAAFSPVFVAGAFDKRLLDPAYVAAQEAFVTRGWRRLQEIARQPVPINEYPLPEVLARWEQE